MNLKHPKLKPALNAAGLWTPEDDAVLADGVRRRVGYRHIGDKIGRSADACRDRAKRIGLVNAGNRKPAKRRKDAYHRGGSYVPNAPGDGPINEISPWLNTELACRHHLADLLREFAPGGTLGQARQAYRHLHETHVGHDTRGHYSRLPYSASGSFATSPACMCVSD